MLKSLLVISIIIHHLCEEGPLSEPALLGLPGCGINPGEPRPQIGGRCRRGGGAADHPAATGRRQEHGQWAECGT